MAYLEAVELGALAAIVEQFLALRSAAQWDAEVDQQPRDIFQVSKFTIDRVSISSKQHDKSTKSV